MKKFTLLLLLAFLVQLAQAAAPTVPSSNLNWSSIDGTRLSAYFTSGNGGNRIVVMKKGSPVTGVPVNGVDYTANPNFGTPGTQFTAPGEYVVSKLSWSDITAYELEPGTVYYFAVFEFNGWGATSEYLMLPFTFNHYTALAPGTQATALTSSSIVGNSMVLSWTKGNGSERIVLARKGAAVNATPANLTSYGPSEQFGSGNVIGTDNFVVYKGTGNYTYVRNLEPNVTYHFAVFEYNGSNSPVYQLNNPARTSATTNAGPTIAATSPGIGYVEGDRFYFGVSPGNGTNRLVIARKGAPVTATPVNGTNYTADAAFGNGTQIAPGEFVVAGMTGTSLTITNLEPNATYHFRVFEYDVDKNNNTYYLTSSFTTYSGSTSITPTTLSSNLNILNLTGNSATIGLTPGNGSYRMAIMKAGSPVDAAPSNLLRYADNSYFGNGTPIAPGNYVVVAGMNGSQFTVNNLQPGITYYVSIYEFNGGYYPVYSATGATMSFSIPAQPTQPSSNGYMSSQDGKSMRLIWTNGNGSRRIVVARKGSAVTSKPVDNVNYTANANFGQGDALAAGEFVVYNGTGYYFDLSNLDPASTYHYAIFEYNLDGNGKPDYLISPYLAFSASTVSTPTTQGTITGVTGIQSAQATINYTAGNGSSRLFVVKEASAVNAQPQDGVQYYANTYFGLPSTLISNGNYAVHTANGGNGSFNLINLKPNTTYHVSAFEYNGNNEPIYLRTAAPIYNFTTGDVPGATAPTVAASSLQQTAADGTKLTIGWTNGNGEKRIVVMRKGSAVSFAPVAATAYSANAAFATGTDLGSGQYIVYAGSSNSVEITGLQPSSTYYYSVYEFNGSADLIRYLSTPATGTASTVSAPVTAASNLNASSSSGQMILSWTNGSGSRRLVVVKESSAVTSAPISLSVYPASSVFKSGTQIAADEYVVYAGTANTVTVTGLTNGKTYYYKVFEFNGSTAPVYATTAASGSMVISSALPVTLLYFNARENNGAVKLTWATAQELNNDRFEIERSEDGVRYQSIGRVAGSVSSNATVNYSFTDAQPSGANVYYRLKQVDRDGQFTYSKVELVKLAATASIRAYPNPVRDAFRIDLPQGTTTAMLQVHDAAGVLVASQKLSTGQTVSSSNWAAGTYYLTVSAAGKQYRTTLVKQ